jgi:mitochondrial fission protein ELM1
MAPPRKIWLLKHCRAGDLHQMRHLGALLGPDWQVEEKQLSFRFPALAYVPGMALSSVDWSRSSDLSPPWPAAILAAEALCAKVAVALKTRAAAETKLVALGRPAGSIEAFDLVLTTRQYGLTPGHNVEELPVPLASPPRAAADACRKLLLLMEGKPRPWVALLIGASVAPDILDQSSAENLSAAARRLTLDCRGSLIAVSSPRTTRALENHLRRTLSGADLLHFKILPYSLKPTGFLSLQTASPWWWKPWARESRSPCSCCRNTILPL